MYFFIEIFNYFSISNAFSMSTFPLAPLVSTFCNFSLSLKVRSFGVNPNHFENKIPNGNERI